MVAEDSANSVGLGVFEGFDWNSVDIGNTIVDWLGFLDNIGGVPTGSLLGS